MRKILLIILISFFSFQSFAQDSELFKTWYLYRMDFDFGEPQYVENIDPVISPYLTINESFEFNGFGACNSFSGSFIYTEGDFTLTPINFENTNIDCVHPEHILFEEGYFFQFSEGLLLYIVDLQETQFAFDQYPGFTYAFSNEPLSLKDNIINKIKIYPNPVSDILHISSENTEIESIFIYSLTGKKVLEGLNETNYIDVSTLSKGLYFIEISSSPGKSIKKFIKK